MIKTEAESGPYDKFSSFKGRWYEFSPSPTPRKSVQGEELIKQSVDEMDSRVLFSASKARDDAAFRDITNDQGGHGKDGCVMNLFEATKQSMASMTVDDNMAHQGQQFHSQASSGQHGHSGQIDDGDRKLPSKRTDGRQTQQQVFQSVAPGASFTAAEQQQQGPTAGMTFGAPVGAFMPTPQQHQFLPHAAPGAAFTATKQQKQRQPTAGIVLRLLSRPPRQQRSNSSKGKSSSSRLAQLSLCLLLLTPQQLQQ